MGWVKVCRVAPLRWRMTCLGGWVDAPPPCPSARTEVRVRWAPVPTGYDHDRSALVPALCAVLQDVEKLLAERGIEVDHVTAYRSSTGRCSDRPTASTHSDVHRTRPRHLIHAARRKISSASRLRNRAGTNTPPPRSHPAGTQRTQTSELMGEQNDDASTQPARTCPTSMQQCQDAYLGRGVTNRRAAEVLDADASGA